MKQVLTPPGTTDRCSAPRPRHRHRSGCRADAARRATYEKLKESRAEHDAILCLDANQAQHNPVLGGGWIKLRRWITLRGNTGRRRLNINGVIDVETQRALIRDDSIDAASTIALFTQIEAAYPKAYRVTVFCDNACY